jgi:GTP-binding protein
MAFIDEMTLYAEAGRGGDGVVRWRHEKGKEFSGASGGNGGKGGDVSVRAIRDIHKLAQYRHEKKFLAGPGGSGERDSKHGPDGKDLIVDLPIGSIITNTTTGRKYSLLKEGEVILLLKGGRGGLGNEHFKASTNTSPKESTPGKEGETATFEIELDLVVDAGLIGLPNAGKSSLLNELTNAKSKVASYAFTTLDPSLGDMEGFILADIPGLIEGASEGRGLGHKFLRHVRRTKLLLHCISLESDDMEGIYKTIRGELKAFDPELAEKDEVMILTKTDLVTEEELKKKLAAFKKVFGKEKKQIFTVTVYDDAATKELKDSLVKILRAAK